MKLLPQKNLWSRISFGLCNWNNIYIVHCTKNTKSTEWEKMPAFLTAQSRTINQCWRLLASALQLSTVDAISSQSSSSVKFTTSVHFPQIVFFSECQFFQRENFSRFVLVEFEIKFDENPCRSDSRTEFHGGGKFAMHVEIYVSFFVFAISPFKCFFSPSSWE